MELVTQKSVEKAILTVRNVQVILDKDLAHFYEVKPVRLREQVKRNSGRFPEDFVFKLTKEEVELLVSQNAIPSKQSLGGTFPYVFTEQGVAAVSGIIKSKKADEVSILIMRTFVSLRRFFIQNALVFQRINNLEKQQEKTDTKLDQVFRALEKGITPNQGIFFEGQIFDAHVFISDLIRQARKSIILIDNYVNETTLLLLSKRAKEVSCVIYTQVGAAFTKDLEKHNEQYPVISVVESRSSHDRFLILDSTKLYHLGASLKDVGKKCFAFSNMDNLLPILQSNLIQVYFYIICLSPYYTLL